MPLVKDKPLDILYSASSTHAGTIYLLAILRYAVRESGHVCIYWRPHRLTICRKTLMASKICHALNSKELAILSLNRNLQQFCALFAVF